MLLSSGTEPTYTVKVHSDSSGEPGGELGELTKKDSLTGTAAKVRFTADGGAIVLPPNGTYWIVVDVSSGDNADATLGRTSGKGEDAGRAAGWGIADRRLWRSHGATAWNNQPANGLKIAVHATADETAPEFGSAAVNGTAVTVSFSEDLDTSSLPAHGDFHVTVGSSRRNVVSGGVAISGGVVTLTLDSAAVAADTVQVRYTQPSSNPLQDAAGNPVATFADQAVINTTGSLVSNAGQTFIPRNIAVDYAQAFTTGSHADGYTLTRVDVFMRAGGSNPGYAVGIHADAGGVPGASEVGALAQQSTPPSARGAVSLAASGDGIQLDANTTYWLVFDVSKVSDTKLFTTPSEAEDAGAAQDWSIADSFRWDGTFSKTWPEVKDDSIQLVIHATPNPTTVAVGNYGQPDGGDATLDNDHAQAFTTGEDGYRLTQVDLEMLLSSGTEPAYTVKVHSDSSGEPGGELGELTKQDSLTGTAAKVRFTADGDGLILAPNGTYWIVVNVTSGPNASATLGRTSGKGEDAGAVTGWSIADKRLSRGSTTTTWTSQTDNVLKIAIYASPNPPLVSNTDQTGDVGVGIFSDLAQAFTTGSNATGYRLTHVSTVMKREGGVLPRYDSVGIHEDAFGVPAETSVGTLTPQGNPGSARGPVAFAASGDGIYLRPYTKYWFVLDFPGNLPLTKLSFTSSDLEDAGAAAGWSIADDSRRRSTLDTSWTVPDSSIINSDSVRVAIQGEEEGPPTVSNAGLIGTSLTVRFNREMDPDSEPAGSDFSVKVDGTAVTLASSGAVAIDGDVVTLTLATAVTTGTVTLDYAKPASNPLRSAVGVEAESFADQPVKTGNTAPAYTAPTDPNDNIVELNARNSASFSLLAAQFSDTDGDELTYTTSGPRDDVYWEFSLRAGVLHFRSWTGCVLEGLDPSIGDSPYDFVVTVKATDPYGASAKGELTFRVTVDCPAISSAVVNGSVMTLGYDGDLHTGDVYALQFTVTVDGSPAENEGGLVDVDADIVTLTLAEPVSAGQAVLVTDTPDLNPFGPVPRFLPYGPYTAAVTDFTAVNTTGSAVSNAAQVDDERDLAKDFAQAFTTGSHAGGYTLDRLELLMRAGTIDPAYTSVGIHADNSGAPGASVGALSTPGAPPSAKGAVPLTASGHAIQLDANTTYWLVLDVSADTSDAKLYHTSSDAEDEGKVQDWSIANTSRNRAFGGNAWTGTPDDDSLQLVIFATPNPTTVAVGNYGQPDGSDATLDKDHAQAFSTGAYGYRLTQVDLEMLLSSGTAPTYTVKVHSDSSGEPGGEVGELTTEDSLTATATKFRFTEDGDGIALTPNATYWIVVDVTSGNANATLGTTSGKGEDAGRATGWSIANNRRTRGTTATAWDAATGTNVLKIALHADITPPAVSSAAVNGATLTVGFTKDLDETSTPAPGDFFVTVGTDSRNVLPGGVSITGPIVFLTLDSAVSNTGTDPVRVAYIQPDDNPLQDIAGNPVASFLDQDVTRNLLVGNLAQPPTANVLLYGQYDAAQSFTTGSTTRYTLTSVQLDVGVAAPGNTVEPTYSVSIHADSSGEPGESLGELTKPAALADGVNTFTAPDERRQPADRHDLLGGCGREPLRRRPGCEPPLHEQRQRGCRRCARLDHRRHR